MEKQTINSLDRRVTILETQQNERWNEILNRIKLIENVLLGSAATIIAMLAAVIFKMG